MRVTPILAVLAGCVPNNSNQPPPPWARQEQPQPAAPPSQRVAGDPAPVPTAPAGSCPEVFGCYTRCTTMDEACITGCESGVDPYAAGAARQLAICTIENQCTDESCQETSCSRELAACAGGGGVAAQPSVATTAAAPAAPSGGTRAQVYVGISLTAGGLDYYGSHDISYRVLFADGTAARMLPPTGLDGVDTATLRAAYTDMIGTYQVNGDQVDLQFGSFHEAFSVRSDGSLEGIDHVAGTFIPADSLDGATLDGTYVVGTATFGFQFTADGRFHADRDATIVIRDRQGNILDSLPEGSGSYRIANNTLTLGYDNGQVIYIAIATIVDRSEFPRPARLLLNTWQYHRV